MTSPLRGQRILMLQASFEMGGAERQGLMLAEHLKVACGAQVEVWALGPFGSASDWCEARGIACRHVPGMWHSRIAKRPGGLWRIFRDVRAFRPDILLPYTMPANVALGLIWRLVGARLCVWNQRDDGFASFSPSLEAAAARLTRHFVSNSEVGAAFLENKLKVTRADISLIRNGVALAEPKTDRASWRAGLGIAPDRIVACNVANMLPHKDQATLIRAWKQVCDRTTGPRPQLLIAGYDYLEGPRLHALVASLGLGDSVRFLGHVSDIPALLKGSDIGVLTSRTEGSSNAVLESMAAGLPFIASDLPANRDALGDDPKVYFPVGDDGLLADRLLSLIQDAPLRARLGAANAARAEAHFGVRVMLNAYQTLLEGLVRADRKLSARQPRAAA